jgi:hypothetical protein
MPELTYPEEERRYWETHMHPITITTRLERLYNEDGSPRLDWTGNPRTFYTSKLRDMDLPSLRAETEFQIWADWYRHPDADWKCMCCYDECMERKKSDEFYGRCHARAERDEKGY